MRRKLLREMVLLEKEDQQLNKIFPGNVRAPGNSRGCCLIPPGAAKATVGLSGAHQMTTCLHVPPSPFTAYPFTGF